MVKKKGSDTKAAQKSIAPAVQAFDSEKKWERWITKHHNDPVGIHMRIFKKDAGVKSITYQQALDVALCYGWIDGIRKGFDEKSFLQKFTPRRSRSIWSKKNTLNIERLDKEGRMKPAGWKQVELAKADGRWERAYGSQGEMKVPDDFLKAISRSKKLKAFFDTLNKTNRFAIAFRLHTAAKPETRQRIIKKIIETLKKGERIV